MIAAPLINILVLSFPSLSFSFSPASIPQRETGLSQLDIDALFLHTQSLDAYAHKPDCFRHAAARVRTRCGEADMDPNERVATAIAMTLCELATARHHSPPLECRFFSISSSVLMPAFVEDLPPASESDQAACVEALSRSAQFWSSYSGYLREVPQLCHAFRRWNDIDTARNIYANATLEKLALLRMLTAREKRMEEWEQRWDGGLVEMQALIENLQYASIGMLDETRQDVKKMYIASAEEMNTVLARIASEHASALSDLFDVAFARVAGTLSFSDEVYAQWTALSSEFSLMHQSIHTLAHTAAELSATIAHVNDTAASLIFSLSSAPAQFPLSPSCSSLPSFSSWALPFFSRLSFALPLEFGWPWWVEVFRHIDPSYLAYAAPLPFVFLRITLMLFRFVGYIVRAAVSLLMSLLLTLFSLFKFLARPPTPSSDEKPIHLPSPPPPYYPAARLRPRKMMSRIPERLLHKPDSSSAALSWT